MKKKGQEKSMNCLVRNTVGLALCWVFLWPCRGTAGDERILYAPDVVGVERMFMIVLKVPAEAPDVKVTMPDSITLFDRTPVPAKSETRKFYFRALKPTPKAEVRFALPAGQLVVPVEIWSFEDLRKFRTL